LLKIKPIKATSKFATVRLNLQLTWGLFN